jgi:uncharacterized protein YbjT (DUF2867 family)
MQMLVTGASGFIGSLLVPRLIAAGHEVRAFARDPARVRAALAWQDEQTVDELEIAVGDALTGGAALRRALAGVEVAYYLIHSMESGGAGSAFSTRERQAAETFAAAARTSGVRRIVYLGGLLGSGSRELSPHLSSRHAVEGILRAAVPESLALRASIVIGARSRSFRLLVHLIERMRVIALPAWRRFRTQPIDGRDVSELLLAAGTSSLSGLSLDTGGPETLTYEEMLGRIAELMLVSRPALRLPVNMTTFTSRVVAAIAGEDPELVGPLMQSLAGDLLPQGQRAERLLGVELHSFDAAVEHALREWESREPLAAR